MISITKLESKHTIGAGLEIYADIQQDVPCVEFTLGASKPQCVVIGYEPYIQFAPIEWRTALSKLFGEMVAAWNEKHGSKS